MTFMKYRWLAVCLGFTLISLIASDCPFPQQDQKNLRFIYQSPRDVNKKIAPEKYLLRFRCTSGYSRIGVRAIVCLDDKWSNVVPTCERMQCIDPPIIENGKYKLNSEENDFPVTGSSAFYTCNVGYELMNDSVSSLVCALNKTDNSAYWLGEVPVCIEKSSCPDPGVSKDGDRYGSCCYSGDVLHFSCNDGYELIGSNETECLPTGIWNFRRPLCKPLDFHCEFPPAIPHGTFTGSKEGDYFRPYDEIEILCETGYSYKGPAEFVLCEENGVWEEEFGNCTEVFCDPPEPLDNGMIPEVIDTNLTSYPYNFEITYQCNSGYRIVGGDSWRFCDKTGWSGKTPNCEEINCPDPGVPEHGSREGQSFRVGEKVLFYCFSGYYLLGSVERYCMPNGQWTGELARCNTETNYCPDPGIPINGFKNSSQYDEEERVGFRCRPGYILLGSEVRECLSNRTWTGKEAKCIGPYDYDNSAQVRDLLKKDMAKKAEEQEKEIQKYREALNKWKGPVGKALQLDKYSRYMLYFIFDASGSVGRANFYKSIEFAKAIVKKVGITENGARAGAITFSSTATIEFLPVLHKNTEDVLQAFDEIEYTGGGTSTTSALQLVITEFMPLTDRWVGKKGVKTVVFILTDGRANMGGDPQEAAEYLKEIGVEIYCIGITGDVRKKTLYKIASDPKEEHVFILENYSALPWLIQEIVNGTIDYSQCGFGLEDVDIQAPLARILGGRKASEPWPWMVAVYMLPFGSRDPTEATLQCGGSIIHENFILTAAHCLYDKDTLQLRDVREVMVKLGLTNVNNQTHVQEPEVLEFIIHPQYTIGEFFDYDIALLHLKAPIEFNAYVRPICLPPAELPEGSKFYNPKEHGQVIGWGYDGIVRSGSRVQLKSVESLKQLRLPIQAKETCIKSLEQNRLKTKLFTDRMFCAGYQQGGNDTCRGDSGGPFMQAQLNSEGFLYWTQVGIVSWGQGCGMVNSYGFYSHVQQLRLWIDNSIEGTLNDIM